MKHIRLRIPADIVVVKNKISLLLRNKIAKLILGDEDIVWESATSTVIINGNLKLEFGETINYIRDTVRASGTADDTSVVTEKAVRDAIASIIISTYWARTGSVVHPSTTTDQVAVNDTTTHASYFHVKGNSTVYNQTVRTSNYNLTSLDALVYGNPSGSSINFYLPVGSSSDYMFFYIRNISTTDDIVLVPNGTDSLNGTAGATRTVSPGESVFIQQNTAGWYTIADRLKIGTTTGFDNIVEILSGSIELKDQLANTVFSAPDGSTGKPTFRSLVSDDIPSLTASKISDFDTEVSNNTDVAANTSSRHDPVTLSTEADAVLDLTNQDIDLDSQAANKVLSSPDGSAGKPSFRSLVSDDIPSLTASKISDFDTEVSNNTDVAANTASRHDPITLSTEADAVLDLTGQDIDLDSQSANTFFAAPNGSAGKPSFRNQAFADLPVFPTGRILYVNGTRTDSYTADGSEERPYKTFTTAIAAVSSPSSTNQWVITCLDAGIYDEAIVIPSSYIHVNAPNAVFKNTSSANVFATYGSNSIYVFGEIRSEATTSFQDGIRNLGTSNTFYVKKLNVISNASASYSSRGFYEGYYPVVNIDQLLVTGNNSSFASVGVLTYAGSVFINTLTIDGSNDAIGVTNLFLAGGVTVINQLNIDSSGGTKSGVYPSYGGDIFIKNATQVSGSGVLVNITSSLTSAFTIRLDVGYTDISTTIEMVGGSYLGTIKANIRGGDYTQSLSGTLSNIAIYLTKNLKKDSYSSATTIGIDTDLALADTTSAGFTLSIPDLTSNLEKKITFKNIGTGGNLLTIDPYSTGTIDGNSTITLKDNESVTLFHTSSNTFYIIKDALSQISQSANTVFSAPDGSAGNPSFRSLVADDIPSLTASKISDFDTEVSNNTDVAANTASRHDVVTLSTEADAILDLTNQDIDLDSQSANEVFSSPDGSAGKPSFRSLVTNDIPSLTASKISDFDTEVSNNTDVAANTTSRHDAVSLSTEADVFLSLTNQDIGVDSQSANTVFAAPDGSAGAPSFRALVDDDMPVSTQRWAAISTSYSRYNDNELTVGSTTEFYVGAPLKYKISGKYSYGIVDAITTRIVVSGAAIGSSPTELYIGAPEMCHTETFVVNSTFESTNYTPASTAGLFYEFLKMPYHFKWNRPSSWIVKAEAICLTADSSSDPTLEVHTYVSSTWANAFTSSISVNTTSAELTTLVGSQSNVDYEDLIDIKIVAGGGGDAEDLMVNIIFVME